MENTLKKIGARVYLDDNDMIIQKVTYIYADGTESEPLSRFVHLGMFTDSILFGENCDIRFFVCPNSLQLYDADVDALEFINNSSRSVTISCFGQQMALTPEKTAFIIQKWLLKENPPIFVARTNVEGKLLDFGQN